MENIGKSGVSGNRITNKINIPRKLTGVPGCVRTVERILTLRGLNPSQVHQKMRDDPSCQERFFAFFEDVIHHHFPDIDVEVDKSFEPRTERPPKPPQFDTHLNTLNEWKSVFCTQVKMCGEALQRHECRKVWIIVFVGQFYDRLPKRPTRLRCSMFNVQPQAVPVRFPGGYAAF